MSIFLTELIGTAMLVLLGTSVVANVVLAKTKGNNSGWIVISLGWGIAVFVGVFIAAKGSGAHLNPAITIAFAWLNKISWSMVPAYIAGQFLGAMAGASLTWLAYYKHFDATEDTGAKLGVFCNMPAIKDTTANLLTEIIGTFVLVFGALFITGGATSLGSLDALPVALLVVGIGLSIGGPTGYAINPARDLGPRIMHALLPIRAKGSSGWEYSWIPVAGPVIGGLIAAILFRLVQ